MWWTNSDTLRTNTQIMHQELKSSHQMEKSSCCPGSWKNDKQLKTIKTRKLENYFLATYLWQDARTTTSWQDVRAFCRWQTNSFQSIRFQTSGLLHHSVITKRISHDIYQSFDDSLETRAVFFDKSKALNNVRHKGLF